MQKHRKWLCKSQGEKKYRALYRYKMNGYKGTRVASFYSDFFYVDHTTYPPPHTHTHTQPSLCVASVALTALGWLWWRAWIPVSAVALCVAGVALGDIDLRFARQAALRDIDLYLRGRRGAYGTGLVLLTRLGPGGRRWHRSRLRGRRGTWPHWPSFCVGGWHFATSTFTLCGMACHLRHWAGSGDALGSRFAWHAWHLATWTFVSRGRGGTSRHRPSLCVGWRGTCGTGLVLLTRLGPGGRRCCRGTLRGRRGTYGTGLVLVTHLGRGGRRRRHGCAWQAWHLRHWGGSGDALGSRWAPLSPRYFAWQAWHLAPSTFVLRGRRGTWRYRPSPCVALTAGFCGRVGASVVSGMKWKWAAWLLRCHVSICK